MKKLYVQQQYTDGYLGDHTPDIEKYSYVVSKVLNSVTPTIRDTLTKEQLAGYCDDADWTVTIS